MEKPPTSGLGRSIDELFRKLSDSPDQEREEAPEAGLGEASSVFAADTEPSGAGPVSAEESIRSLGAASRGDPFLVGYVRGAGKSTGPFPGDGPGGDGSAVAMPADHGGISGRPGAELAGRLAESVAAYLDGSAEDRDSLAPRIVATTAELKATGELAMVADGVIALSLAGGGGDDQEALALARELLDAGVARRIALRIGGERDDEVKESLVQVAKIHPEVLTPALTDVLAEASDRGARRSLMEVIRGQGEPAREAVLGLLEDDRWYAVRNGVVLLGEMGGEDAVQTLTVALGHEDSRVRREAVTALSKLGGEEAGLLLVGMLEDGSPEVRAAAATGVGLLRVERAQRPLEQILDRGDSEDVLVPVLRALGQLGDPGPVPAIEKRAAGSLFSRPPRDVRIAAYRALGAIGTPHARMVLRQGAGDKDPEVQHAVGMILRQLAQERQEAQDTEEERTESGG